MHALLRTARLAQHEHGRFMLTVNEICSRRQLAETWRRVALALPGTNEFDKAVFETVMSVLLAATGETTLQEAVDEATVALNEYGWEQSASSSGSAPRSLNCVRVTGARRSPPPALAEVRTSRGSSRQAPSNSTVADRGCMRYAFHGGGLCDGSQPVRCCTGKPILRRHDCRKSRRPT